MTLYVLRRPQESLSDLKEQSNRVELMGVVGLQLGERQRLTYRAVFGHSSWNCKGSGIQLPVHGAPLRMFPALLES